MEGNGLLVLAGCYATDNADGLGLYAFDVKDMSFRLLDSIHIPAPSYLTIERTANTLYVVDEQKDDRARLLILRVGNGHQLKILDSCPTKGASPCYVSQQNHLVATANYRGGSVSLFLTGQTDEELSLVTIIKGKTGGPDMTRQEVPHMHCALFSPDGRYVFTTDFSADQIVRLEVDRQGTVTGILSWPVTYEGGYGPRHLLFSTDGRFLYVIGELSDSVTVFSYQEGNLTEVQTIVADEDHGRGGGDIRLSPDGRFLYSSHRRKRDKVVCFSVNQETGRLTNTGYVMTKAHPRQFCLTPDGKYMLVACMEDDIIEVLERDLSTGLLSPTGNGLRVRRPAFVDWMVI